MKAPTRPGTAPSRGAQHPPAPWWREAPALVTASLVVASALLFGALAVRQHARFGTWGYDLGIYDQAFWLVSRGRSFITVRGMQVFGHHLNLVAYLFAPAYRLGAGPRFLVAVQAAALAAGAVPVHRIVADRTSARWAGTGAAAAYLLYAPVEWLTWANFHPEALAVTPLLCTWSYATRRRPRAAGVSALLALAMREEAALVLAAMGVALGVRAWRSRRRGVAMRRATFGLPVLLGALGLCWFAVASWFVIPHFNGGAEAFYVRHFYGSWGASMAEVARNVVLHPLRVLRAVVGRGALWLRLLLPTAGVVVCAPAVLLVAAPQLLVVALGNAWFVADLRFQYMALLIPGIVLATAEGFGRAWQVRSRRRVLVMALAMSTLLAHVWLAPSPLGVNRGTWAVHPQRAAIARALRRVPRDASVAASDAVVPHLTHRDTVYELPNPFVASFYGSTLTDPADANAVEWVVALVSRGTADAANADAASADAASADAASADAASADAASADAASDVATGATSPARSTTDVVMARLVASGAYRVVSRDDGVLLARRMRRLSASEVRALRAEAARLRPTEAQPTA